jgi:hypothetical protein
MIGVDIMSIGEFDVRLQLLTSELMILGSSIATC